ncbi:MAG: permease [Oceanospirillaceae bacterium]|nr:permease [Oceanospirillaceae bacterium]MCP5334094.1 permease [Oceanospirillaceae bacterium]MCP5351270.1 permease [Oceanospirillaceae bacterium]
MTHKHDENSGCCGACGGEEKKAPVVNNVAPAKAKSAEADCCGGACGGDNTSAVQSFEPAKAKPAAADCCGGACGGDKPAAVQSYEPPKKKTAEGDCCGGACGGDKAAVVQSYEPPKNKTAEGDCCGGACGSSKPVASKPAKAASCHPEPVAASCCGTSAASEGDSCCAPSKSKIDWLLYGSGAFVIVFYALHLLMGEQLNGALGSMAHTAHQMANAMWWGVLTGAVAVGVLGRIPREFVMSVLGKGGSKRGVIRATLAGVLLDLCNHGILMVAMRLYERGASIGQVMAFMIASPWNSFTLTLILIGLIGLKWTLLFIAFSMLIAWISGMLFDHLVQRGVLPPNPNAQLVGEPVAILPSLWQQLRDADYSPGNLLQIVIDGLKESRMVLRWVFFGVVVVSLVRAFVNLEDFQLWFGATTFGLLMTLLVTTVLEVCSEGSSPIAADLVTRAHAPGNGFTFLMAGAATDYTEIMVTKSTTRSWKIALFLPLITVPQVLLIGWIMNQFG